MHVLVCICNAAMFGSSIIFGRGHGHAAAMRQSFGHRPQWVRFASPQLAPTAPATAVFIALSSECHLVFIEFSVDCSSAGVWVQGPFLPLPQIGFAVACGAVCLQTFGQAHAVCLVDRRMGRSSIGSVAFMQVRGQQWEGICCCWPHSAMPSPALCLDLGPKGLVGSGNMQS